MQEHGAARGAIGAIEGARIAALAHSQNEALSGWVGASQEGVAILAVTDRKITTETRHRPGSSSRPVARPEDGNRVEVFLDEEPEPPAPFDPAVRHGPAGPRTNVREQLLPAKVAVRAPDLGAVLGIVAQKIERPVKKAEGLTAAVAVSRAEIGQTIGAARRAVGPPELIAVLRVVARKIGYAVVLEAQPRLRNGSPPLSIEIGDEAG